MSLSRNKIYQGDCVHLLRKLDKGSVDLVFADPPFNIGFDYDVYEDSRQTDDYLTWCRSWIKAVHRCLKPTGTFWLAIGDEYAAELKIEAQKEGFHCRSWVIWYYTFGVNCANGFSRSHTHLLHFVKDKKDFTFNRSNPQVRVKSARQMVYADARANPNGRLPDNTWITRPQDAPDSFSPNHDTWYFARVAGTFKERQGFHGCQMPEQLLARIIRVSSNVPDLVVDPFGGSGTTLCVAKKLGRQWLGFELSKDYAQAIDQRLQNTEVGDGIDGPHDPIRSAPNTTRGKWRKKAFDGDSQMALTAAFEAASGGHSADYLLCDKELNAEFHRQCRRRGVDGNGSVLNQLLLQLRKSGKLPKSTKRPAPVTPAQMDTYGFASEVAWRLLAIDYGLTLDNILSCPEFALEFDRLAAEYGPIGISPLEYRRAAISIRKRSNAARRSGATEFGQLLRQSKSLRRTGIEDCLDSSYEIPGVFLLFSDRTAIYAWETENIRGQVEHVLNNSNWLELEPDSIAIIHSEQSLATKYALKSAVAQRENPLLNCRLLVHESELPT